MTVLLPLTLMIQCEKLGNIKLQKNVTCLLLPTIFANILVWLIRVSYGDLPLQLLLTEELFGDMNLSIHGEILVRKCFYNWIQAFSILHSIFHLSRQVFIFHAIYKYSFKFQQQVLVAAAYRNENEMLSAKNLLTGLNIDEFDLNHVKADTAIFTIKKMGGEKPF